MPLKLELPNGEQAEAESLTGEILTARSPRPYAPGTPLQIVAVTDEGRCTIDGKTVGAKKRSDNAFEIKLRLVSLRRSDRELLTRALASAESR